MIVYIKGILILKLLFKFSIFIGMKLNTFYSVFPFNLLFRNEKGILFLLIKKRYDRRFIIPDYRQVSLGYLKVKQET